MNNSSFYLKNKQTEFVQNSSADEHARLMAERFFPPYIRKVGQTINAVHKISQTSGCKLTMGVLSVALKRKLKPVDIAFYRSGQRALHTYGPYKFYTYTYGKGPAVLLLHGWCSDGSRWAPYVQHLTRMGFQSVVMDAPSHGQSPGRFLSVPGYIRCINQVFASRAHWHAVVTHSMGSLTGVIAASEARQQAHATRFVLMNTFSDCDALMSKFSRCLGISEKVLADTRQWIPQYAGKPLEYFTLANHFQQLESPPALLVADTEDIVVPQSETQEIIHQLPYIERHFTTGLGHNLRCDQVMHRVLHFVGR
jgi:pimeloyl-ACP methyl ester carboxylesterase